MKWVDLKLHLAPLFTQQIDEVSKHYLSKEYFYKFDIKI
jgi:hypothetical protein